MENAEHRDNSVKNLLGRLPEKADNSVGRTILTGRALSRSADTVHLAIASGIVGVPIANIETVIPVVGYKVPPNLVQIAIRNPQEIRSLLSIGTVLASGVISGVATPDVLPDGFLVDNGTFVAQGIGVSTCVYTNTDTVSGGQGELDQSDDCYPTSCSVDDTQG
jgi:hypothetical protein